MAEEQASLADPGADIAVDVLWPGASLTAFFDRGHDCGTHVPGNLLDAPVLLVPGRKGSIVGFQQPLRCRHIVQALQIFRIIHPLHPMT
jgi:hypothetical protein